MKDDLNKVRVSTVTTKGTKRLNIYLNADVVKDIGAEYVNVTGHLDRNNGPLTITPSTKGIGYKLMVSPNGKTYTLSLPIEYTGKKRLLPLYQATDVEIHKALTTGAWYLEPTDITSFEKRKARKGKGAKPGSVNRDGKPGFKSRDDERDSAWAPKDIVQDSFQAMKLLYDAVTTINKLTPQVGGKIVVTDGNSISVEIKYG